MVHNLTTMHSSPPRREQLTVNIVADSLMEIMAPKILIGEPRHRLKLRLLTMPGFSTYRTRMLRQLYQEGFQGKELRRLQLMKLHSQSMNLTNGEKNFGRHEPLGASKFGIVFAQPARKDMRQLRPSSWLLIFKCLKTV